MSFITHGGTRTDIKLPTVQVTDKGINVHTVIKGVNDYLLQLRTVHQLVQINLTQDLSRER